MTSNIASRFRGTLLGTFVGDALGLPFEGTPLGDLARLDAALERRTSAPQNWGYSDDTDMTIGVAESLVRRQAVDAQDILTTLAANYDPARGYGKGMKLIMRALDDGAPSQAVATRVWPEGSRGNGGAARVGPIACLLHHDEAALDPAVVDATRSTHAHAIAIQGAVLVARAIAFLLRLPSPDALDGSILVDHLLKALPLAEQTFRAKLDAVRQLLCVSHSRVEVVRELGHGVEAHESVPLAVFAFLSAPRSFTGIVLHAIRFGGDTDTIGAMAGSFAGALFGDAAIPAAWRTALENGKRGRDHLVRLADERSALWRSRRAP